MDQRTAAICLQFLQRMTLTGAEVQAFLAVSAAVNDIARGASVVISATGDALPPASAPAPSADPVDYRLQRPAG